MTTKTVWTLLSDNDVMDAPNVMVFDTFQKSNAMMTELMEQYVAEHNLDKDTYKVMIKSTHEGFMFRFTGGEWEEWVYISETEIM